MVQTLLAVGLPGSRVVLVQPPLQVPTCFNNPFIEDAVNAALKECGKCVFGVFFIHSHLVFFFCSLTFESVYLFPKYDQSIDRYWAVPTCTFYHTLLICPYFLSRCNSRNTSFFWAVLSSGIIFLLGKSYKNQQQHLQFRILQQGISSFGNQHLYFMEFNTNARLSRVVAT